MGIDPGLGERFSVKVTGTSASRVKTFFMGKS